jgi:hypothetical protein
VEADQEAPEKVGSVMLTEPMDNFLTEYIHGDKFAEFADFGMNCGADGLRKSKGRLGISDAGHQVAFVKADYILGFFKTVSMYCNPFDTVTLVTHNSDQHIVAESFDIPEQIVKWYALNSCSHGTLPIPSGMERPAGGGYSADPNKILEAWKWDGERSGIFGCWNESNNAAARRPLAEAFRDRAEIIPFGISHMEFLLKCRRAKFVLSPEGNGVDCHRTWEALYMGAVPIVKASRLTEYFAARLPMIVYSDEKELTDEYIESAYDYLTKRKHEMTLLTMSYWKEVIRA